MQVSQASAQRADVIAALRKKAAALENHLSSPPTRAAHDELVGQADYLERAPGLTLAEGRAILSARNDELRHQRNLRWAAGGALFALGAACCFTGDGGTLNVIGRLTGCMGGAGVFIWGSTTDDRIDRNKRMDGTLQYWESEFPQLSTAAPAGGGALTRSTLKLAAPENMKSEMLDVMSATHDYLAAQPQEPAVNAALRQVRTDRRILEQAPGDSLQSMRDLASADTARANKLSKQLLVGSLVAFGAGIAGIYFNLTPLTWVGTAGGAVMAVRSGLYSDHEGRNNRLIGTIHRWELQLDGLKNVARSAQDIQGLASGLNGQGTGIQAHETHVVLGGIRVPVRVRASN